jgi:hypothetical protein
MDASFDNRSRGPVRQSALAVQRRPVRRPGHGKAGGRSTQVKYILLIYGAEHVWQSLSREQMEQIYAAHRAYGEELRQAGALLGGDELKPVATATTVRFSRGRPKTLDGPFAETKEQLAGYYLIDAENLDAAIRWAVRMPGMSDGAVEIRPLA